MNLIENLNQMSWRRIRLRLIAVTASALVVGSLTIHPVNASTPADCLSRFAALAAQEVDSPISRVLQRSRGTDFFEARSKMLEKSKSLAKIDRWNAELMEALEAPLPPSSRRRSGMSQDQAKDLYQYLSCHPVAGMAQLKKYDPKGNFGFCFGRATAAHLEALRRGLARARVIKIWGVGPMKGGWGHHVATLVAAQEGGWWAIDPEIGRVVSGTQWVQWLRAEQENAQEPLVFFVSEAERFGPTPGKYSKIDLYGSEESDIYNGFFRDLIEQERKSREKSK